LKVIEPFCLIAFMQRFFVDFEALDRFTLSLACFDETLQCPHCAKSQHLVSHGIVYKQRSIQVRERVGKRVFCSNRYHHSGCGRTAQLYVAGVVPSLQYSATQVFLFVFALLKHASVKKAYQRATGQGASRNAWRWLHKAMDRLTDFRCFVKGRLDSITSRFACRCRRLKLLLPTLQHLFSVLPHCPCSHYQLARQAAFI
jgi:hypothetical protein